MIAFKARILLIYFYLQSIVKIEGREKSRFISPPLDILLIINVHEFLPLLCDLLSHLEHEPLIYHSLILAECRSAHDLEAGLPPGHLHELINIDRDRAKDRRLRVHRYSDLDRL